MNLPEDGLIKSKHVGECQLQNRTMYILCVKKSTISLNYTDTHRLKLHLCTYKYDNMFRDSITFFNLPVF
jgi:hypothetical protein